MIISGHFIGLHLGVAKLPELPVPPGVTHIPLLQVAPTIVQSWHAAPPVPHAVSSPNEVQPWVGLQQPMAHVLGPHGAGPASGMVEGAPPPLSGPLLPVVAGTLGEADEEPLELSSPPLELGSGIPDELAVSGAAASLVASLAGAEASSPNVGL
jgi:hypothetical protein